MEREYVQENQPDGVPPLPLTGERTLPDVPEENYWYRRHLVVYEWIAARCAGLDVVDMACGEGYGSDVLARRAARVTGVDANPEAHDHARLKYTRPGVRFARELVETWSEPCDAVVFLQTIEHVQDPAAILRHFRGLLRPGGVALAVVPLFFAAPLCAVLSLGSRLLASCSWPSGLLLTSSPLGRPLDFFLTFTIAGMSCGCGVILRAPCGMICNASSLCIRPAKRSIVHAITPTVGQV